MQTYRDWHRIRRLTSYLMVPTLAIWGLVVACKLEFRFNDFVVEGPLAILFGIGLVGLAAGLLAYLLARDKHAFENYDRE